MQFERLRQSSPLLHDPSTKCIRARLDQPTPREVRERIGLGARLFGVVEHTEREESGTVLPLGVAGKQLRAFCGGSGRGSSRGHVLRFHVGEFFVRERFFVVDARVFGEFLESVPQRIERLQRFLTHILLVQDYSYFEHILRLVMFSAPERTVNLNGTIPFLRERAVASLDQYAVALSQSL